MKSANLLWHVLGGECKTCQHPLAGFEIDNTAVPRICHARATLLPRFFVGVDQQHTALRDAEGELQAAQASEEEVAQPFFLSPSVTNLNHVRI